MEKNVTAQYEIGFYDFHNLYFVEFKCNLKSSESTFFVMNFFRFPVNVPSRKLKTNGTNIYLAL